jgi:D-threo-aldose 1-dehydrogenase
VIDSQIPRLQSHYAKCVTIVYGTMITLRTSRNRHFGTTKKEAPLLIAKRRLGATPLELTELGYGCAALGSMYKRVTREQAEMALTAAWEAGIRYFDTAPGYGAGMSERIVGDFLRGFQTADYILSTKIGKLLRPSTAAAPGVMPFEVSFDYSYDGVMRSFEASLVRLGLAQVQLLLIDDLEPATLGLSEYRKHFPRLLDSGMRALEELKSSGDIVAFGLGVSDVGACIDVLHRINLDCLLLNGRYTLLDRTAGTRVLGMCRRSGTPLIVGSLFNGGALSKSTVTAADLPENVALAHRIADSVNLDIGKAAVQFPLRNPLVVSALLGSTQPARITAGVAGLAEEIPESVWGQFTSAALN